MPAYMLDTDISSYIMKRSHPVVLRRLQSVEVSEVSISAITKCELMYGVEVSPQRVRDEAAIRAFLRHVQVLDFSAEAAPEYASIRADLKLRGALIGANDLFIAAHALSLGLTLVSNNTAEFGRVKGLKVENWTEQIA
jgi:tRNA(fMet)-specific endonuclease VapC